MKKLSIIKLYNFSRSTTFIFGHLVIYSFDIVVVTLFTSLIYLSCIHKLYERYVNFVNNVTITLWNKEMTKIKVVDLDEFYNFMFMTSSAKII
jgi:hypothetical protein